MEVTVALSLSLEVSLILVRLVWTLISDHNNPYNFWFVFIALQQCDI